MNYEDAFKIGSKCDGYIRCTYAKLHNYDLGVVFSLQAGTTTRNKAVDDFNLLTASDLTQSDGSDYATHFAQLNTDTWQYFTLTVPICKAYEHIEIEKENEYVPIKLTQEAVYLIKGLLEGRGSGNGRSSTEPTVTLYKVYRVWIVNEGGLHTGQQTHHKGDKDFLFETYNASELTEYREHDLKHSWLRRRTKRTVDYFWSDWAKENGFYYVIEEEKVVRPEYVALIEALDEDLTFYVKACAIDWIPTNVDAYVQDPNGQMVKLADRLADARKRMETAKALLAIAATLTII